MSGPSRCKDGTEWSDGTPLTSEDVVFTIEMLKEYAPQLNWSGAVEQWVESVEAVDDRTIKFTLDRLPTRASSWRTWRAPPRRPSCRCPSTSGKAQDPITFRNEFDAETGAPVFSGPYVVKRFSSTEFVYKRNDDWWGAKSGALQAAWRRSRSSRRGSAIAETINQMLVNNESDIGGGSGRP